MKSVLLLFCKSTIVIVGLSSAMGGCAAPLDTNGNYVSVNGQRSTMQISGNGNRLHIAIQGGANPTDMTAVAGDCEAVAEGQMRGDTIQAKLIPFDGEVISLDAVDIAKMNPIVLVTIKNGFATVQGSFSHCGLRNDMAGKYRKIVKK